MSLASLDKCEIRARIMLHQGAHTMHGDFKGQDHDIFLSVY